MTEAIAYDLLVLLSAGLLSALACRLLNISVLIGYLVVGAVIGRGVLGWVVDEEHQLAHFAEIGVFLLLFTIGLEFSIEDLKRLGTNFVLGGTVQMLLVAGPIAAFLIWMGLEWQAGVLIASAFAFSSTVLVFRSLSESGHTQTSHGRRAIGILLYQDAALVPLLLLVPFLTNNGSEHAFSDLGKIAVSSLAFVVGVVGLRYMLGQLLIPILARYKSSELVVLFTVVSLGGITLVAYSIGLPAAVGAFAAGLVFNGNRWSHQIDALVLPFRETFAAVFFVGLGLIFDPRIFWLEPQVAFLALPVLIVVKAGAAAVALRLTGLPNRTAVGAGVGLAHVGEFAFVLALLGMESGVLKEEHYQQVVAIAVLSLVIAPSLMKLGLSIIRSEVESPENKSNLRRVEESHSVVIGAGPIGRSIASQLETMGNEVTVVDLSPLNLHAFAQNGFHTIAGDATDAGILDRAGVVHANLIVVSIPEDSVARQVVRAVRKINSQCGILVRCRYQSNIVSLRKAGATEVVAEESEAALALLGHLKFKESVQS